MDELYIMCFVLNVVLTTFAGIILSLNPFLTRKSYLFGVSIPELEQSNREVILLKRRYLVIISLSITLIILLEIIQFLFWKKASLLGIIYYPLLIIAAQFIAHVPSWKGAKVLRIKNNWAVSHVLMAETRSSYSRGRLYAVPWFWYGISLFVILSCTMVGIILYPNLPKKIPTHFDFNMEPNQWKDKSIWIIMIIPFTMIGVVALMAGFSIIIEKGKLHIDLQNPSRVYRRYMGHGIGFAGLISAISFGLLMIPMVRPIINILKLSFILTFVL